ncbi:MAG TPA: MAPEG family protein [Hypericibacter adhaerens]|jgi:glutathione S-transferase|uniref:Glutathione S-transferase n=1 Tax=Hypericibacter adhaerens TaxID=2602016 RepID=A0A5J6MUJ3_9PROT|nr:MAPEG family protein [Hypericibacter adhaerens]QEX21079.1 glutathione S-transferase [Hypericibacter adhaerens]HWA46393.1 MAPEG family protein [Hypericibacter adhaerens]
MADPYAWPALATIAALLVYLASFALASRMRAKHRVVAPSTEGPEEFKRALRIQANTLEQLVPFLASLWLFALFLSPVWAALLGAVWVAGRIFYLVAYFRDPATRGPGFVIAAAACIMLLLGALVGVIDRLLS